VIGTVSVEGFKELDAALKSLDPEKDPNADRIVGRGLKTAANVVVVAARQGIHSVSGLTVANLKARPGKRRKGFRSYVAGVSSKWYSGDQFYFSFVEFGHKQGSRRLGASRKQIPGEHAIEYAFDQTAPTALMIMQKTMLEIIAKAKAKRA
jgi:hypothetical protein